MSKVLLTSFKHWFESGDTYMHEYDKAYSVAVYQPHWYLSLPKLNIFDIRDDEQWIRPRNFVPDDHNGAPDQGLLENYHAALDDLYTDRALGGDPDDWFALEEALTKNVALCCWCPYDKAAQRQLKDYGSFVCHTWAIETFLERQGHEVVRDPDRRRMVGNG